MKYISTRGNHRAVESSEAILMGMVPAGGLFVPRQLPEISPDEIEEMKDFSYKKTALTILGRFLTDYTRKELQEMLGAAYNDNNFNHPQRAPLIKLAEGLYILELWHGPTAAFKDMALQLMPHLLVKALQKHNIEKEIVILVATSGDTGKAALEGFRDVKGVNIIVFYPDSGVSKVQERQMVTTKGDNTAVVAIDGNFDHCQTKVKEVFADTDFRKKLEENSYQFSSANSINWGRLVPQIVYYFYAYARLCRWGEIECGQKINVTVPTGNFGNILAGYYAYRMGLPVNRFICASNDNKILTDFLRTGVYDTGREFKKTISPSMDILISSNLERFLFEITEHDSQIINDWYAQLANTGKFDIGSENLRRIQDIFSGEFAVEEETKSEIKRIYEKYDYTLDPHTAVGVKAYSKFKEKTKDELPVVIDSTASPYKFSRAVLEALEGTVEKKDEFEILKQLQRKIDIEIHPELQQLEQMEIRHQRKTGAGGIKKEIKDILDL